MRQVSFVFSAGPRREFVHKLPGCLMRCLRELLLFCLLCICLSGLVGCSLLNSMPFVGEMIPSASRRQHDLAKRIGGFNQAVYWGSIEEAAMYASPEKRALLMAYLAKHGKPYRVVDQQIVDMSYDSWVRDATIKVSIRYYREPSYVVASRTERQTWEYNMMDGWLLTSIEGLPDEAGGEAGAANSMEPSVVERSQRVP